MNDKEYMNFLKESAANKVTNAIQEPSPNKSSGEPQAHIQDYTGKRGKLPAITIDDAEMSNLTAKILGKKGKASGRQTHDEKGNGDEIQEGQEPTPTNTSKSPLSILEDEDSIDDDDDDSEGDISDIYEDVKFTPEEADILTRLFTEIGVEDIRDDSESAFSDVDPDDDDDDDSLELDGDDDDDDDDEEEDMNDLIF